MSAPPGQATNPNGNWSIVGFVKSDALIAKERTLARVPIADLRKVASLNKAEFYKKLNRAGMSEHNNINMALHLNAVLGIDILKAQRLLNDHNFKKIAQSLEERDEITKKFARIIGLNNG